MFWDKTTLKLNLILQGLVHMSAQLDTLKAAVAAATTLEESTITLINGLAAQISALSAQIAAGTADASDLQALADSLTKGTADLQAAVSANTPAAPVAPTDPTPAA